MAQLSYAKAKVIRAKSKKGVSAQALADKYGVGLKAIQNVISGKAWRQKKGVPEYTPETDNTPIMEDLPMSSTPVTQVKNPMLDLPVEAFTSEILEDLDGETQDLLELALCKALIYRQAEKCQDPIKLHAAIALLLPEGKVKL